jgi:hypothetical protein
MEQGPIPPSIAGTSWAGAGAGLGCAVGVGVGVGEGRVCELDRAAQASASTKVQQKRRIFFLLVENRQGSLDKS